MASELQCAAVTGQNLYGVLLRNSDGLAYNPGATAFQTITTTRSNFSINMTEVSGTGMYRGDMPSGIGGGTYQFVVYKRQGGSPANTDPLLGDISPINWGDGKEISSAMILGLTGANTYTYNQSYSQVGNLLTATVEIYDSETNASNHDHSTGLLAVFSVLNTESGFVLTSSNIVRTS